MVATTGPSAGTLASLEAGTCFESLESPWTANFESVSCDEPHTAQLTAIVPVEVVIPDAGPDAPWPGNEVLRERAMIACQSPEAIDLDRAEGIADLQVLVRWPASEVEWDGGLRSYYCFARSASQIDSLEP